MRMRSKQSARVTDSRHVSEVDGMQTGNPRDETGFGYCKAQSNRDRRIEPIGSNFELDRRRCRLQ